MSIKYFMAHSMKGNGKSNKKKEVNDNCIM